MSLLLFVLGVLTGVALVALLLALAVRSEQGHAALAEHEAQERLRGVRLASAHAMADVASEYQRAGGRPVAMTWPSETPQTPLGFSDADIDAVTRAEVGEQDGEVVDGEVVSEERS